MKIAIVSGAFPDMPGGVSDYTGFLAEHLAREKNSVTVITSKSDEVKKGRPVKVLPVIESWDFSCLAKINAVIEDIRPDIIQIEFPSAPAPHGRHPAINLLPLYLKLKGKKNIVFTSHEFGVYTWKGKLRQLLSMLFADKVVAVTHSDLEKTRKLLGGKARRINIGANVTAAKKDAREIKKIRKKIAPNGEAVACFFGRFAEQKGLETLLESLSEVAKYKSISLMMIGEFENEKIKEQIKGRIKRLGIGGRIHWTGYLREKNLSQHFYASDFCVLPFEDGITFRRGSYLAAVMHNLPVISTRSKLSPSALEHGKNIYLVAPNNSEGLIKAITELIENPMLRKKIGEESEKLVPLFDWSKIARAHLKVYQSICK